MPGNPGVFQGILIRVKASFVLTNFPNLNVTAPYLDKGGISLRLEGNASMQHGTMTGLVQSPEPYMTASITIMLLKTQPLSEAYKTQMEALSLVGDGTVWPDVTGNG